MSDRKRAVRVTAVAASAQFGGTERVLLDFAARAFEHDVALRVLTPRDGPLIPVLNEIGVPAAVVPAPQALLRGSQQIGHLGSIPWALAGLARWSGALAAHPYWREADVLYTIAFKAHVAAALRRRRPVVWHLHEFPPATTGRLWRVAANFLPDALIANSEATGRAWRTSGRSVRRTGNGQVRPPLRQSGPPLSVIPNGVDLDRFHPRERTHWIHDQLRIPRTHRLVGMPAVLARWKGQLDVMDAWASVARDVPDTHLVLVGGSIYDTVAEAAFGTELERRIAAGAGDPARERIHLLPFQAKVERVYPEFDLVIHYSLRPEAFGRVIVEALACGVPVAAAAEGGPLEILTAPLPRGGSGPGWLVPPRDAAALAATLRRALALPSETLTAMGAVGRQVAEDRYSARRFARDVAEVLRRTALELKAE